MDMRVGDKIHLYLGCTVRTVYGDGVFCGISCIGEIYVKTASKLRSFPVDEITPILTSLEDIHLNNSRMRKLLQFRQVTTLQGGVGFSCVMSARLIIELLEAHVDVFGWIEQGHAIRRS